MVVACGLYDGINVQISKNSLEVDLGCDDMDSTLPSAWVSVKGVWASIWNERAHLARQKLRLDVDDVYMAVLCQKVVDADYAIHPIL